MWVVCFSRMTQSSDIGDKGKTGNHYCFCHLRMSIHDSLGFFYILAVTMYLKTSMPKYSSTHLSNNITSSFSLVALLSLYFLYSVLDHFVLLEVESLCKGYFLMKVEESTGNTFSFLQTCGPLKVIQFWIHG